ncbi:MAG: TetR family transcriptional regulator [Candidatus Marinimicrobia bacterium]|nr:TetR family transcriptional regulator [Candidatus Neomarinimicrobiota bacterium]
MAETTHENNDNKQKILDSAARLFAAKGYDGVSVREIAEASEVTKPVIYYYFKNKEDLYDQLIKESFAHAAKIHNKIYNSPGNIEDKLRRLMRAHFRFGIENPDVIKILYDAIHNQITDHGFGPPTSNAQSAEEDQNFYKVSDFIKVGQTEEKFRGDADPTKIGMIFVGAINMFILYQLHSKGDVISDKVADEVVDVILNGILPREEINNQIKNSQEASDL